MEKLPRAARALAGTLDFRMRGRQVELTRTVQPRQALGAALLLASPADLANNRLVYQITLPTPTGLPQRHPHRRRRPHPDLGLPAR